MIIPFPSNDKVYVHIYFLLLTNLDFQQKRVQSYGTEKPIGRNVLKREGKIKKKDKIEGRGNKSPTASFDQRTRFRRAVQSTLISKISCDGRNLMPAVNLCGLRDPP